MADRRTLVGIGDTEGISRAQDERNRVAKYLQATYTPVVKVRGNLPPIPPEAEISSTEYVASGGRAGVRLRFANEVAEAMRAAMEEE